MKNNFYRRFRVLATHASEPLSKKPKALTLNSGGADKGMSSSYASFQSSPKNGACYPTENMNRSHEKTAQVVAQVAGQNPRFAVAKLVAFSGLVVLLACNSARTPSSTNFTNAINQYLAKHGQACTAIGRQFPIDIPASASQSQYGFGPQLIALQQAGLVFETDTTAVVHGMLDALRGPTPPQPVRRYRLTAEGQKYFQQIPGTFGQTGGLCFGQRTVDSIRNWTDPVTVGDSLQSEVTYTYKIENLAAWAKSPEIQRAFPDIAATVNGTSNADQRIGLERTNDGWKVVSK